MIKILKYIGLIMVLLISLGSVYSVTNDAEVYYSYDDGTFTDLSGNSNTGINQGTINTSGILSSGRQFDGSNDYINPNSLNLDNAWSMSTWVYVTATNDYEPFFGSTTGTRIRIIADTRSFAEKFIFDITDDSSTSYNIEKSFATSSDPQNNWVHIVATFDDVGNTAELYIDGVSAGTSTPTGTFTKDVFRIGEGMAGNYVTGKMDEFAYYDRVITSGEVSELYNGGVGYNPYSLVPGFIITNLTNNGVYSNTPLIVGLNTSNVNTNMSYSLNGGSFTSICSNCNITTQSISFLEGLNNVSFKANTSGTSQYTNYNLTIDTINPIVSVNSFTEHNDTYTFNTAILGGNCQDTNIDTCIFYWDDATNTNNGSSKTFTTSGNHSFTLNATDLAGNIGSASGVIYINPVQYFHFEDEGGSPITDFQIGGDTYSNYYSFELYDYSLGSNSVQFSKLGYQTQNINFITNNTALLNETFTASTARILLYIRDQDTGDVITGINFTTEFVATVGYTATTTTGLINITDTLFQNEEYLVVVSNDNYQTESIYFDFNNQQVLTLNAYMINSSNPNLGNIFIKPVDSFGNPIVDATVKALQWSSTESAYQEVSQSKSGSDGLGTLNVILNDKVYIFSAESQGVLANTTAEIIDTTENGKTVTILLSSATREYKYLFQSLYTSASESFNNVTNTSTVTFTWNDNSGISRDICINSYRKLRGSETRLTTSCTSGVSGVYQIAFSINNSYTTLLKAEVLQGGAYYPAATFTHLPQNNVPDLFESLGLAIFIVPLLFLGSIALAMMIQNTTIGTFILMLSSGLSLLLAPDVLTKSIVAFLFFMGWLTINYGVKQR